VATDTRGIVDSSAARAEILRRIRAANGTTTEGARTAQEWSAIERNYRRGATLSRDGVLDLLEDRLRDYDAHVVRVASAGAADAVAKMLKERGYQRLVIPEGLDATWVPAGFDFTVDQGLSAVELGGFDGVVTGATLAIAETGSVVLQNVAGQGRRAVTLVPDYHLCLVRAGDVVETVPEAIERLQATAELPTTFFSGPSATADIEMTRIKGVHGPRFLDVVLLT
jgi:L-lactate dehydrogenase complex protein LldG